MTGAIKGGITRTPSRRLLLFLFGVVLAAKAGATPPAPFLRLSGEAPGDLFGWAVACPGDVNGDGYDDVLVGAPGLNGTRPGKAYVYFGGPRADSIPDVLLDDGTYGTLFGASVAGLGDVNGDGRPDFVVGEPLGNHSAGGALLYFGGAAIHAHADVHLSPQYQFTSAVFGWSVGPAGDMNGDGYRDILIGAPRHIDFQVGLVPGRAYVVHGGAIPDSIPNAAIESPSPPTIQFNEVGFGYSAAIVGDVNRDGKSDFAIAQGVDPSAARTGVTFLYLGGMGLGSGPDVRLESRYFPYPQLGPPQSISPAGDVNGDGYDDFLVQGGRFQPAPQGGGLSNMGGAFVYFGGPRVEEIQSHREFLPSNFAFGSSIAGGRDVNGDGYPDIVIGSAERALVYFGGPDLDSIPNVVLPGTVAGSHFGDSVSEGDLNGDGVADVVVGAWGLISPTSSDPGHVYVYDLSVPLRADAFVRDGNPTIPLTDGPPRIWVQYEPVNGDYQNADVDLSSLRLTSEGTGDATEIPAAATRRSVVSDTDRDGIPELSACFERSDLARLFSSARGRHTVELALEGRLERGRKFRAPLSLTILGTGKPKGVTPSLAPNPLNPRATLTFSMATPGSVTVRLYDLWGRSVRTVIAAERFPAGVHHVGIDGRDERGTALASGVYFYKVETPDAAWGGRFVVLK
jgi:hypothetical protein